MAYLPLSVGDYPNLVNLTKAQNPDGKIAKVAEILDMAMPVLEDIPMVEANNGLSHIHTLRAGLPTGTFRKFNSGVAPEKTTTEQVTDTAAMLETYAEVDKALADMSGDVKAWRASQDRAFLEGMSQNMESKLWYSDSNVASTAHQFHGFTPRYNSLGNPTGKPTAAMQSDYLQHVISAGGDEANKETSVWCIGWSPNTVYGFYPKGSQFGLKADNKGAVTSFDDDGNRFEAYRTHYKWDFGLAIEDWRYVGRICNVDLTAILSTGTAADMTALLKAMIKMSDTIPNTIRTNKVFYCSPGVFTALKIAAMTPSVSTAQLTRTELFEGRQVTTFAGIPIKPSQNILETEAVLS